MSESERITRVHARQILDSRGNPTVEVDIHCRGGVMGRASVPSGASTGRHEAKELGDGDTQGYGGKGVSRAVASVRDVIGPRLLGMPVTDREGIDHALCELDGTPNKSRLGANAILGVSLACAHAAAAVRRLPLWRSLNEGTGAAPRLPLPMVNLISGGRHAGGNLAMQDFLLLPIGAETYSEALETTVAIYRKPGAVLVQHGYEGVLVGDEGGYGPRLRSHDEAIELILEAMTKAGYTPGRHAAVAVDVASTQFYRQGRYHLEGAARSADEMVAFLERWVQRYPILSIGFGDVLKSWAQRP